MWGHVLTEASTQQNFNFGFSTYKSEILIHLSQWQYWWWFWFSMWWALYYFIIFRTMTKRTFNFNIALNTSVRGRGKWGDFLVALIPISWCCNILINSNFILRMIEWQNESSLFTIRIQGKQWYWVYKYDPNTAISVNSHPINMGHNKWRVNAGQESYNADTYYQAIHLAAQLEFQDSYSKFTTKAEMHKKHLKNLNLAAEKVTYSTTWNAVSLETFENVDNTELLIHEGLINKQDYTTLFVLHKPENNWPASSINLYSDLENIFESDLDEMDLMEDFKHRPVQRMFKNTHLLISGKTYYSSNTFFTDMFLNNHKWNINDQYYNAYYDFLQLDETSDVDSNNRHSTYSQPFRLARGVMNQQVSAVLQDPKFIDTPLNKFLLLVPKYMNGMEGTHDKELLPETLWGFRQKKYKRVKKYKFKDEMIYDPDTFEVIGKKPLPSSTTVDIAGLELWNANQPLLKTTEDDLVSKTREKALGENINYRIATRINRHRSELVPVTLARRLLRTKRTLVLPAHVNLTVITNSYDVVHSWFVPGLGLKLDCVPGRSTHHTFYVDNIGFYYGQCAEICGRYHHHMPIRLCAISFDHFIVWWQSKGLARMNRTSQIAVNKFLNKNIQNNVTREKLIYKMN